jgi:hypothetical protein
LQESGFSAGFINEYALHVAGTLPQLPPYDTKLVQKAARATADALAIRLEMGRFHSLLPGDVALAATLNQLNLPQFGELYASTQINKRPDLFPQLDLLLQ